MKTLSLEKSRIVLFALTMPLILGACGTVRHDTRESTSLVLPPIIQYEGKNLERLAQEAESGSCPAHVEFGKDYIWTRDKLRAAYEALNAK